MKRQEILDVIKSLSHSQGSYGRLYEYLTSGSEDAENDIATLEEQGFKTPIDLVLYLEN